MSMPNIPDIKPVIDLTLCEVINMLLASIAMEEMGLSHVINAEGEKIQYVLNHERCKDVPISELIEINESVERVIKETTKLQMFLKEKLDSIIKLILKKGDYCPLDPCPPKPKHKCILKGAGKGCICNKKDPFCCGTAFIESNIHNVCKNCCDFSLKYKLSKEQRDCTISAVLIAIPESVKICCRLDKCSSCEEREVKALVMKGQGMISSSRTGQECESRIVNFELEVWDYNCRNQKFNMIISSPDCEFNHDSGIVSVTSGWLEIEETCR